MLLPGPTTFPSAVVVIGLPLGSTVAALALSVVSAACYASSAVLQQREAASQSHGGAWLVLRLARRPWWWVAIAATVVGAMVHVAALAVGSLSLVQPMGVLTLVLALPLGARLGGRVVTRREWCAAVSVAFGLVAVLGVAARPIMPPHLPIAVLLTAAAAVASVVLVLAGVAARLPERIAPVGQAVAAATCFGFASAMARTAVTGAAPFLLAAIATALAAVAGLGLAQLAYRRGGLGAPLATLNMADPLVAVLVGVTVLGEPLQLTLARAVLAVVGLLVTGAGIWALTHTPEPPGHPCGSPENPPRGPGRSGNRAGGRRKRGNQPCGSLTSAKSSPGSPWPGGPPWWCSSPHCPDGAPGR